jgi:signal transduction histidine kinase/ligand-binding sensor domain-containing protein
MWNFLAKSRDCLRSTFRPGVLGAVVLLGVGALPAHALDASLTLTQYVHRIWQMQQGLPEATIYSIGQTTDGFLWLGTQRGVVRFDGVQFTAVRDTAGMSLENLWVRDVLADAHNGIWLATDAAGLLYLKDGVVTPFTSPEGLSLSGIHDLLLDHGGNLWAADDHGVMSVVEGKINVYGPAQGLMVGTPRAVCEMKDGRILVGGDGPLLAAWNGSKFTSQPVTSLPASASIRDLTCAIDGTIWIASSNGLVRLNNGVEKRFTTADGLPNDWVDCVTTVDDGSVFAGTRNGFIRIRGDEIETFGTREGLSQSTVYSLFQDREGSLWVGTKHGLNQLMDRRTIPYTASEGLASNNTGPVFQDGKGGVWVGTLDAGLSRFDGQHFSTLNAKQGLTSNTVYSMAGDGKGGLWVGTAAGLDHLRDGKVDAIYTTKDGLPFDTVLSLLNDSRGTLWAGTSAGLARLEGARFIQPDPAIHTAIHALAEHNGQVLASSSGGALYTVSSDGMRQLPLAGKRTADIDALYQDSDGLLWIGARGGELRVLDGGKTYHYTVRDGLYDDDIYGIVGDPTGKLWFACSKGIFSVSREELKNFRLGAIKTLTSTPFSPLEGLRTIECNPGVQPAAWAMPDGKVWFSTIHGALMIDAARLERKYLPVPVIVEDVVVNGSQRSAAELTNLPPGDSNVEFLYTALTFIVPTRVTFRYQLEGFDHDWVDAGTRREAFYTNLRPGNYRFRVKAQNIDNTWSEIASPVAFTLAPHFYQRRWFVPLCVALLIWIGWFAYRQRVRQIRQRLDAVLTERSRIARELHDTLMQGFSGITMEMQALSTRLPETAERSELNDIIQDAGTCLREARQSIAGLRTARDAGSGLAASIEQHARQMTEAKDVRLKLKLDDNPQGLPAGVEYNLLRIAQEAVTNSVKHSGARTIEVSLDSTAHVLKLSVKDDGSGMNNSNGQPGHYGLIGMRERAAQIGAAITIDSEAGRGTVISVLLPNQYSRDDKLKVGQS